MSEMLSFLPGWIDIIKVPFIMFVTAVSVAIVVIIARFIFRLLIKISHTAFGKHKQL